MTLTETDMATAKGFDTEDRSQEYLCLLLEGYGADEAYRLSARVEAMAGERGPGKYGRGGGAPLQGLPHDWPGMHTEPMGLGSLTMDNRSDEEREADWAESERATLQVRAIMAEFMSPLIRETFEARYLRPDGTLTVRETAALLGVPLKTVERRVERARKIIREALAQA